MDVHDRVGDWQESQQPPDLTLCGQIFGKICPMRRSAKECKKIRIRETEARQLQKIARLFTSLIPMMRNSKTPSRMRVESVKFRFQPQCFANFNVRSTVKTCRVDECKTKCACIVEADESIWKRMEGSPRRNHEDHIAGKGMTSLSHYT